MTRILGRLMDLAGWLLRPLDNQWQAKAVRSLSLMLGESRKTALEAAWPSLCLSGRRQRGGARHRTPHAGGVYEDALANIAAASAPGLLQQQTHLFRQSRALQARVELEEVGEASACLP